MSDDKTKSGGQDRSRIDVNQAYELRDWSKKFGALTGRAQGCRKTVGDRADAVQSYLKGERKGPFKATTPA